MDRIIEQKIKDAANIVDVVGEFVNLKKRGADYVGLCPFHDDRHIGSFKVSESRNICSCFSCNSGTLDPIGFLMKKANLSYTDALLWLAKKYNIDVQEDTRHITQRIQVIKPKERPKLPILSLKRSLIEERRDLTDDNLCNWIKSLPWDECQRARIDKVFSEYEVGHSKKEGHTIFWHIDEKGTVHTGKMMLYKKDGHRDKETRHNFDYIHKMLFKHNIVDENKYEYQTDVFGLHLLKRYPRATINLVESEKTALIGAIAWGNSQTEVWMATGGMQFFTGSRLQAIMATGRKIRVFPDIDGIEAWRERARQIGYHNMTIDEKFVRAFWKECDGPKADIADMIVRSMTELDDKVKSIPVVEMINKHIELIKV